MNYALDEDVKQQSEEFHDGWLSFILKEHIFKENWSEVRSILLDVKGLSENDFPTSSCQRDSSDLCLMSLCLGFHSPIDILSKIYDLDPSQVYQRDKFEATILHHACTYGSSFDTIANHGLIPKSLVSIADVDGRLPLHTLMSTFIAGEVQIETVVDIIRWMVEIDSEILFVRDKYGSTPIDIIHDAVTNKNSKKMKLLTSFLRAETVKIWRINKTSCEQTYHLHPDADTTDCIIMGKTSIADSVSRTVDSNDDDLSESQRNCKNLHRSAGISLVRNLSNSGALSLKKWKGIFSTSRRRNIALHHDKMM